MARVFNFYAGPATLPVQVLEQASKEMVDYKNSGMSIMEVSHRSKLYEEIHNEAIESIKSLYKVPENYSVIFMQGGASSQFFLVPMNLLGEGETADYINTGEWSTKAIKEAKILGKNISVIASSESTNFDRIPDQFTINKNAKYVYMVSNNTIFGTQYKKFPETNGIPLVIDASSDIFSYPIDWKNVGLIYAGAQKNAGPSGLTIVIIRKDLLPVKNNNVPTMLRYITHADNNSLYNTPPTYNIYLANLNLRWLKSIGGIEGVAELNKKKGNLIYETIDNSSGYYKGHAQKDSRSLMNITFNLKTKELEEKFAKDAEKIGLIGLKGHRSVGGIRASVYNAMPVAGCEKLKDYMIQFMKDNP